MGDPTDPIPFRPRGGALRLRAADPPPWKAKGERPTGLPPEPGLPTDAQRGWLARGLDQPGGKLPLFDEDGQRVDPRTVRACLDNGWAAPWFFNPLKPDWLVCRLTDAGRRLFEPT